MNLCFKRQQHRWRKLLFAGVVALSGAVALLGAGSAHAQLQIVNDDGGANDPNGDGQNDLTQFGRDDSDPDFFLIKWSWDEPSTIQGGNASNACGMFDSDGDGDVNYSFCLEVSYGDPDGDGVDDYFISDSGDGTDSTADFPAWIECSDAKDDRCTQPDRLADPYNGDLMGSSCTIMVSATDPFPDGNDHPNDLMATCEISKSLIPAGAEFVNVCSYPSAGNDGNNNPFDCVVTPGSGFIEIAKVVTDAALDNTDFTFTIEPAADVNGSSTQVITGAGTTDLIPVDASSTFTISESEDPLYETDSIVCEPPAGSDNGTNISGVTVSSGATTTCTFTNSPAVNEEPGIAIVKSTDTPSVDPGADVVFTLNVTVGIGNVALNNVDVVDAQCSTGPTFVGGDTNSDGFLDLNETWNYSCTVSNVTADFTNTATASGTSPAGTEVEATDTAAVTVLEASLGVTKALTSNADGDGSGDVSVGDVLTYTITATNTGDANLTNVVVSDSKISPATITCAGPLSNGATCVLEGTYTVTAADVMAGSVDNTGTANSDQTGEEEASVSEPVPVPELSLVKSGVFNDENGDTFANAGSETISYSFVVASTGTANLTNVLVSDPLQGLSAISCPSGNPIEFLAAGDQETCTATYTITQDDVDAGVRDNVAFADSNQTDQVDSPESVDLPQNPDAVVTKSSDPVEVAAAGTVINYSVLLDNTGNVTLDPNDITLTDLINGTIPVTLSPAGGDTDGDGQIDVTEAWSYTGSYTVTQADMDAGAPLVNTVCISDVDGSGVQEADECGDATTTILQLPDHSFDKNFVEDPVDIGSDGSFTLTYTNTGNVTLSDVEIVDQVAPILDVNTVGIDVGSCDPASQAVSCSIDSLAPGGSAVVTVDYTAAPDLPMSNQTSGASYVFYFANGYVLTGSTADGTATLTDPNGVETPADVGGANQDVVFNAPDGQTFTMHLSCSEPFVNGYGLTGPTEADNPEWQISNYSVDRYNSQGFLKACGQTFIPLYVDNIASAQATPAGGDLVPNPIEASDSVELLQTSPIEISRQRVRKGDVELQYFNTSQEAVEIDIIGVTWTDGAVLESASYQDGTDLSLSGGSPQSADISNTLGARKKDWLRLSFNPGGVPDGLVITIVTTDGSTLTYEY